MKKFLLVCFSFCFVLSVWAQERVITGRVTSSDDGSALPGVNVVVKGTTNGTVTDADGKYSLSIPSSSAALIYSFIGLKTTEVVVGERTVVDVQLGLDITQLTEVVVTAQGIEKSQKSLGYYQTTISASTLASKPETDIGRALQGRTPGLLALNTSGLVGSGTKINLRGIGSLGADTQPLWVVDGVPINTSTNDINGDFRDGQISPTRFLDIDPNNIESMTVLSSLSATTTYGSLGRNGVIIVTTKTASSKNIKNRFEGSISQSYFANQAVLPEYQNKWANGFDGAYGEFFSNWGSLMNGTPTGVNHPYYEWRNIFPQFPEFATSASTVEPGQTLPGYVPKPAPNNVKDFFKTGFSSTTSVNLTGKTEFGSVGFSYSHLNEEGFVKNNDLVRDNLSFGGNAKLTEKLSLTANFNYARTSTQTPPAGAGTGSNSNGGPSIWANLFYTPRNIDLSAWPFENPVDGSNVYYRNNNSITNPYWLVKNTRQGSNNSRFFSSTSLNYKATDWLNITYRLGFDTYTEGGYYWINKGGGNGFDSNLVPGALRTTTTNNTIIDQSLLFGFNKDISQALKFNGTLGLNLRLDDKNQQGLESLGQVVFGFLEHRNYTSTQARNFRGTNLNFRESRAWRAVFFDANFDYKNYLYLTLTSRLDQASFLLGDNQYQYYPGVTLAFVPTTLVPNFGAGVLDFLKIRAAYSTSANFGDAYNVNQNYYLNSQAFIPLGAASPYRTSGSSSRLANSNLKPELLQETEFGIEAQLFESRIKLNASAFDRKSKDLQLQVALDGSTGYTSTTVNAGEISNKGLIGSLTVTPIKTSDWVLDITANYTKIVSRVNALVGNTTSIGLSGFTTEGNFAEVGQPLNVIKGTFVPRSPSGELIVTSAGSYAISPGIGIIADPNPQWFGSAIVNLRWKSLTLGMQWDYVSGGQVLSYTASALVGRGVSRALENFDPTLPLVLPGVNEVRDGAGNVTGYTPNNIPLTTAGVFFGNTIIGGGPSDRGVFDATRLRFREISLSYSLPTSLVSKLKLKSASITLLGNSLWWKVFNAPDYTAVDFDRTGFGTGQGAGFDYVSGPSARRFGATLRLTF
ncbi:MAG: SusC/RagA family TonB-linked outer membrane protein [Bacteroidetes bacterium]|nr:SusC/RagA family TonB-linked outer membrane protein [Bacteroidota bacterium]